MSVSDCPRRAARLNCAVAFYGRMHTSRLGSDFLMSYQHRSCRAASPSSPARRAASARSSRASWPRPARGVALAGRRVERLKSLRAEIEAEGGDAHVVRARRHRPRQHQGRPSPTPRPRWARSTSWSTTRAWRRRSSSIDVDAGRLRLRLRHQRARRLLRRAGGRQAHDRARQGRGARHLHRRAHRQHRLDGGPAGARRRSASTR